MNIDYDTTVNKLKFTTVSKPLSGTISGHAAGEPFDKHVYDFIKNSHPKISYRHYEFLNELYLKNPTARDVSSRHKLIKEKSIQLLLNRGIKATKEWSKTNLFTEKQNDTADILLCDGSTYEIIDVKTKNLSLKGQPPNIISSEKLANYCAVAIDNNEYSCLNIVYLGIDWNLSGSNLVCEQAVAKSLFKADPTSLYINWAAALQIQFHVENLDQSYKGSMKDWCLDYLKHYITSRKKRVETTLEKKIKPLEKYLSEPK